MALIFVVLAGTVGGVAMLSKAFRESGPGIGATPTAGTASSCIRRSATPANTCGSWIPTEQGPVN